MSQYTSLRHDQASDALSLDFSTEAHQKRGLEALQSLHTLEDKVLPLSPRLSSLLATVETLREYEDIFFSGLSKEKDQLVIVQDELRSYETQLRRLLTNVELLEKRVQEILKLVSYRGLFRYSH
jgi:chromosome segregation ATPase